MRRCSAFVLLLFAVVPSGTENQTVGILDVDDSHVAMLVRQLVEQHLAECHLVLASTARNSSLVRHISRRTSNYNVGVAVVGVKSLFFWDQLSRDYLLQGLWGDVRSTCRALVLHLTNSDLALRFFEVSGLYLWPETFTVIVGPKSSMEAVLFNHSLRNNIHVLYLAPRSQDNIGPNTRLRTGASYTTWGEHVDIYHRCLYCNEGEMDIRILYRWHPSSGIQRRDELFKEQLEDFMGHKFRIRANNDFPLSSFRRDSETPGTTLTPVDSLDARMLKTFASYANFTYEVREPQDRQYGVQRENGNWTGSVGVLQHHQADFSMVLTLTPTRHQVLQYSSIYVYEAIVIISLKPTLLPQHLAIIRPFTGGIWVMLIASVFLWAIALWLLQRAWSWMLGGRGVHLTSAFFYSWSVLMQNWMTDPPVNITGRFMLGLWLMACIIITAAYRSSLVAHLIVQEKEEEINTFQDLLARDGWAWGTSRRGDAFSFYFKTSPEPGAKEIYERMQFAPRDEQFRRVLAGGYSHIAYKFPALAPVAASYTNKHGYTPFHFSRTVYPPSAGEGWGFRKGAPFRHRISQLMQRLLEGGLIDYWLDDIMAIHVRENSRKIEDGEQKDQEDGDVLEADERRRVLGLQHMLGAFYIMLLGFSVALLTLLGEILADYSPSPQ